jgi:hypothetical protein
MISALARSPWHGSTDIITARLSVITPPATEPLTIAELRAHVRLDETAGEPSPAFAPTVALAAAGAGLLENGAHRVALSYVTADGETLPGPLSAPITVVDKTINGKLAVSAIPVGGSAVTSIKLWMPAVGTLAPLLYAGSVANGVTTATINLADASLGVQAPTVNTTANAALALWNTAARSLCESDPALLSGGTGRALITQTLALTLDGFPSGWNPLAGQQANAGGYYRERSYLGGSGLRPILLPRPPLQSVTSITYVDATTGAVLTWDPSLYTVETPSGDYAEPGRIFPTVGQIYPIARAQPGAVVITFVAGYGTAAAVPAALKAGHLLLVGNWWRNREAGEIVRGSADVLPFGVDALWQPFRVL